LEIAERVLAEGRVLGIDVDQRIGDDRGGDARESFASAGMMCHGAHSVLVWVKLSE
jgi:hypothetical protein